MVLEHDVYSIAPLSQCNALVECDVQDYGKTSKQNGIGDKSLVVAQVPAEWGCCGRLSPFAESFGNVDSGNIGRNGRSLEDIFRNGEGCEKSS